MSAKSIYESVAGGILLTGIGFLIGGLIFDFFVSDLSIVTKTGVLIIVAVIIVACIDIKMEENRLRKEGENK